MEAPSANHLSPEVLHALESGRLDEASAQAIFAHLDACAECRQVAIARTGDSFLRRLRGPHPSAATESDARAPANTAGDAPPGANAARLASGLAPTVPYTVPDILPELRDHSQYDVLKELGRGGMGVVYLARNKLMDRPEVLKVVNKQLLDHPGAAERFLREIRSAAKLSHPNIVTAHSAFQAGELLVFAMEYVEGQTLAQFVQAYGRLPVANACYYAHQVALGLQHAFEKGMVHRDIKPQNLILARENKKHIVKILDFGLAKATREGEDTDRGLTGTGAMLGTPDYIAPEQTLDAAKADIRADIYSLGCTLYYLLAGTPPFKANSQFELLRAHHQTEATRLDRLRADVPAELANVVAKMMAKDPAKRYQKPAEVAQALAPFVKATGKSLPSVLPAESKKKSGPEAAAPPAVLQKTVIEGSATVARGMQQADAVQARQDAAALPSVVPCTPVERSPAHRRAHKKPAAAQALPAGPARPTIWLTVTLIGAALVVGIGLCCAGIYLTSWLLSSNDSTSKSLDKNLDKDKSKGGYEPSPPGDKGKSSGASDKGVPQPGEKAKDGVQGGFGGKQAGGQGKRDGNAGDSKSLPVKPGPREAEATAAIKAIKGSVYTRDGSVYWVSLSNCGARDADLAHVRDFPNLERLDLIGGEITEVGMAYLAEVPTLKDLTISQHRVTGLGIQVLGKLPRLERLYLSPQKGAFWTSDFQIIGSCTELNRLTICHNQLPAGSLKFVGKLPRLKTLELFYTKVTDDQLDDIVACKAIEELNLQGDPITGKGLRKLSQLPQLSKLVICYLDTLADDDFKELRTCRQLKKINIRATRFTAQGVTHLKELPNLQFIYLENNRVTDAMRTTFKNYGSKAVFSQAE
jgi:serine/threonine protein kinase